MHLANAQGSHVESSSQIEVRILTVLLAFRRRAKEFLLGCKSTKRAANPFSPNLVPLDCKFQHAGSSRIAIEGPSIGPSHSSLAHLRQHTDLGTLSGPALAL